MGSYAKNDLGEVMSTGQHRLLDAEDAAGSWYQTNSRGIVSSE
jgi:hypothetical protein